MKIAFLRAFLYLIFFLLIWFHETLVTLLEDSSYVNDGTHISQWIIAAMVLAFLSYFVYEYRRYKKRGKSIVFDPSIHGKEDESE